MEIRLQAPAEGVETVTVVKVLVEPGVTVRRGAPLLELETDKANMEFPSPADGRVESVAVKEGQKLKVGEVVAVVSGNGVAAPAPQPPKAVAPAKAAEAPAAPPPPVPRAPAEAPPAPRPAVPVSANGDRGRSDRPAVPAGPATRRLARELGVDLHRVPGSARGGRVTLDDVKAFVRGNGGRAEPAPAAGSAPAAPPLPDFSKYGPVERRAVGGVRKKTAENMALAWRMCPSVTQYDLADITDLEAGRKRVVEQQPKGAAKITMTVLALKAAVAALKAFPTFNASFDAEAGEIIHKRYYHIGVAVDTEHGLFVPVIRDVDRKSVGELARELTEKADQARAKRLPLDDMRGGTFTITNLGGIGGTAFSPIINYPEVAILGLSRSSLQPVVRGDKIEPRLMLPLCLTYDHRIIDGADGARFTTFLARLLSDPVRLLLEA